MIAEADDDLIRKVERFGKFNLYAAIGFIDHGAIKHILAGPQCQFRGLVHRLAEIPAAVGISVERISLGHRAAPSVEGALSSAMLKTA